MYFLRNEVVLFLCHYFAVETVTSPGKTESGNEEISKDETEDARGIPTVPPTEQPKKSQTTKTEEKHSDPLCVLGVPVGTKQVTKSETEKVKSGEKCDVEQQSKNAFTK